MTNGTPVTRPVDQRVSVALCTYNGAAFLGEQLRSISAQTLLPGELVISDDGSTDGTLDIVEAFARDAPFPVRLLRNERALRTTANFEQALRHTTGSLLVLSDQDDSWHPDRLERSVAVFDADPAVTLLFSDATLVDGDGTAIGYSLLDSLSVGDRERGLLAQGADFEVLLRRNIVTGATAAFRRSQFELALPFPAAWVHDEWLAIIAATTGRVALIDEELIDYRLHGGNQIGTVEPTFRYKVGRLLRPGRQRNQDIAAAIGVLVGRYAELGPLVPESRRRAADHKLDLERFRAQLPAARWRRVVPVLLRARRGDYQRYTSQGALDILRDLLQPA